MSKFEPKRDKGFVRLKSRYPNKMPVFLKLLSNQQIFDKINIMSLVTIPEASRWASEHLRKDVLPTNISYLVQYGKVKKHGENGSTMVDLNDLKKYYDSYNGKREVSW